MANELDATQGEPDGVTAAIPGNETAPEQNENEQHDNTNETDASAEGSAEHDAQGEGEGGEEGADAGKEGESESQKRNKLPWYQKRINEETNRRRELDRKLQEYEAEIQRLKSGTQPDTTAVDQTPDIETLVDRRAQEKLQQQALQQRTNAFDATGAKEFGRETFDESCNLVASLLDPREITSFMDVLTDPEIIQDGHKVVVELANDPEEAERILRLPPVKRTAALLRLADRISQPLKPALKPISKAPAPVAPVGGNTKPASVLDNPEASQEEFDREFKKMMAARPRR